MQKWGPFFSAVLLSPLYIFPDSHFIALTQVYNNKRKCPKSLPSTVSRHVLSFSETPIPLTCFSKVTCLYYMLTTTQIVSTEDLDRFLVLENLLKTSCDTSSNNLLRGLRGSMNNTFFDWDLEILIAWKLWNLFHKLHFTSIKSFISFLFHLLYFTHINYPRKGFGASHSGGHFYSCGTQEGDQRHSALFHWGEIMLNWFDSHLW